MSPWKNAMSAGPLVVAAALAEGAADEEAVALALFFVSGAATLADALGDPFSELEQPAISVVTRAREASRRAMVDSKTILWASGATDNSRRGAHCWQDVSHAQYPPFVFGLQCGARGGQSPSLAHITYWFDRSHEPLQEAPLKSIPPG
jgi:hypothetical protein